MLFLRNKIFYGDYWFLRRNKLSWRWMPWNRIFAFLKWHFRCGLTVLRCLLRSMSPWESDKTVSRGKAPSRTSKMHIYGAAIFLPSYSSLRLYLSIRSIVWWGSKQQWQRTLPRVFITVDFPDGGNARFARASGIGAAEKRRTDREIGFGKREREKERPVSLSTCSFINWRRRSDYLFSVRSL